MIRILLNYYKYKSYTIKNVGKRALYPNLKNKIPYYNVITDNLYFKFNIKETISSHK